MQLYSEFEGSSEKVFAKIKSGEPVRNLRGRMRCKDGSFHHILMDSGPCYDAKGNFSHTGTFIRDDCEQLITEMTLKEQLEKTASIAREKDRFIRTMFHEIKTPLHILASTTQALTASAACSNKSDLISIKEIGPLAFQVRGLFCIGHCPDSCVVVWLSG